MAAETQAKMVKVHVTFDDPDSVAGESMWAKTTESPFELEIANIPFFTEDIALGDIVRVDFPKDGLPEVIEVVKPSGDATVLALFKESISEQEARDAVARAMEQFDCKAERGFATLWAFSIAEADANDLWKFLEDSGLMLRSDED
jgi:hypothetical protein